MAKKKRGGRVTAPPCRKRGNRPCRLSSRVNGVLCCSWCGRGAPKMWAPTSPSEDPMREHADLLSPPVASYPITVWRHLTWRDMLHALESEDADPPPTS